MTGEPVAVMDRSSIRTSMSGLDDDREAYLRALLEPEEEVLAIGPQGLVTPRRKLFA